MNYVYHCINFHEHIWNGETQYVYWDNIKSGDDKNFYFEVRLDILSQQRHRWDMFWRKCQVRNEHKNEWQIVHSHHNLQFRLYDQNISFQATTTVSCSLSSWYTCRRYVYCVHNVFTIFRILDMSNIFNTFNTLLLDDIFWIYFHHAFREEFLPPTIALERPNIKYLLCREHDQETWLTFWMPFELIPAQNAQTLWD